MWSAGGCSSWYLDEHGRNVTLWPRTTFVFRWLLSRFDVDRYVVTPQRESAAPSVVPETVGSAQ